MEKIQDLIDIEKSKLVVQEDKTKGGKGIYIKDLTEIYLSERSEFYECMRIGNKNRKVASTEMNSESSRSH